MPSVRFRQLCSQDALLRKRLFPIQKDWALVSPTASESLNTLAYRLFVHAELEGYLEDRALDLLTTCDEAYRLRQKVSVSSLGILGFSERNHASPPGKVSAWNDTYLLEASWKKCVSALYAQIKEINNGIKEKNVLLMFVPLGISPSVIDPLLLAELSDLGKMRGDVAHRSIKHSLGADLNPKFDFDRVDNLLLLLEEFDKYLSKIRAAAR